MKRHQLVYLLPGLGILAFACSTGREVTGNTEGAASLSPGDEYLASEMLAELPPTVAASVRGALNAAPGPKSQHALIELFGSPKMLAFTRSVSESDCTPRGDTAAIYIADWARSSGPPTHGETPAAADDRIASALAAMAAKLETADVSQVDHTIQAMMCANSTSVGASCPNAIFPKPTCASSGDDDDSSCSTTATTCAVNDEGAPADLLAPAAAETQLASLFREADAIRPSRAMEQEWSLLRDRYRAALTHAARSTLSRARHAGSETLARDASARRRFDEGGRMVDAFTKAGIATNVDAMNLLHAAISTKSPGQLREAGHDASMGRGADRRYLPGAAVASATADAFAMVRTRRAIGDSIPAIAASLDQRLISIHPYADANGRTTRLMTDWILAQGGYPPALDTQAGRAAILLWERPRIERGAHLEHITEGMRCSVELIEALG